MKTPERTELTKAWKSWCPNRERPQLIRGDKRTDLLIAKAEVTSVNPHVSVHKLLTAEVRKDMILPLCSIAPLARCTVVVFPLKHQVSGPALLACWVPHASALAACEMILTFCPILGWEKCGNLKNFLPGSTSRFLDGCPLPYCLGTTPPAFVHQSKSTIERAAKLLEVLAGRMMCLILFDAGLMQLLLGEDFPEGLSWLLPRFNLSMISLIHSPLPFQI
ncbi:unnamed protein product [Natator depressus]